MKTFLGHLPSRGGRQPPGKPSSVPGELCLGLVQYLAHSSRSVNIDYVMEKAGTSPGSLGTVDLPLSALPHSLARGRSISLRGAANVLALFSLLWSLLQ